MLEVSNKNSASNAIYMLIVFDVCVCVCVCVCDRYPGFVIWLNYEVVGFQPRSKITTVLDSVAYCSVFTPCPPCYYSPWLRHHTGSFTHLVFYRLRTSIYIYCTRSSANLGISRLRPSIIDFLICFPTVTPGPYCVYLSPRCLLLSSQ